MNNYNKPLEYNNTENITRANSSAVGSNFSSYSPYSALYNETKETTFYNTNTNTNINTNTNTDSSHFSNTFAGESRVSSYSDTAAALAKELEQQEKYLSAVRRNINLLPAEYRDTVKRISTGLSFVSYAGVVFCLTKLLAKYPDMKSGLNAMFLTITVLGCGYSFANLYYQKQYSCAYEELRKKYQPEEIEEMLESDRQHHTSKFTTTQSEDGQEVNGRI